jgi:phosphonate transport system substrate-binding protein
MILDGRVDSSAIDSTVLEMEIANHPSISDRIRVIEILGPSPIPPWVVSRDLSGSLKDSLRSVFLEMHQNDAGRTILREAMIDRFASVSDHNYDPIREMELIAQTVRRL